MNGEDQSTDSTVIPSDVPTWFPSASPAPRAESAKQQPPPAPDDSYFASAATTLAAPPSGTPGPVVMPTESGYSSIPPETRRALPVDSTSDPTRLGGLVDSRARYAQEMSDHPELRGKVMAITDAEVGDDNPQAKRALIETIFNRAAARGMSLSATLASRHNPKTGAGAREANASKMHAAQTGGGDMSLGPSAMDQAAVKQGQAMNQQADTQAAQQAMKAQGAQAPVNAPAAPAGPQGTHYFPLSSPERRCRGSWQRWSAIPGRATSRTGSWRSTT
jgi:hypothetical protein